jgi:hypothetical protein
MKTPTKFVKPLTAEQREQLKFVDTSYRAIRQKLLARNLKYQQA